jgi:predicted  nucleic acid-binding Zn-ribbon protein
MSMGLKELEEQRQKIMDSHTQAMIEINEKLVKQIDNGLKERETAINTNVGVLDKIKVLFSVSSDKGLKMKSEQRLELAKLYFDLQQSNISEIMKGRTEGYKTQLSDIKQQIDRARERIAQIEDELSRVRGTDSGSEKQLEEAKKDAKRGGFKNL